MKPFGQGFISMSAPTKEIEKDIIEFSRRKGIPRIKTDY